MKINRDIRRHHHLTLNVGVAQEDYDFHTKVLGLKSIKKTALYDGDEPILHLYYGNANGDPSTLITCFPMRQSGRKARPGTGQICAIGLSVPGGSLGFWRTRLHERGFDVRESERFGQRLLGFAHPCGIPYEMFGIDDDARTPYSNGAVPTEHGIRGTHGIAGVGARSRKLGRVHAVRLERAEPAPGRRLRALRGRRGWQRDDNRLPGAAEPRAGIVGLRRRGAAPLRVRGRHPRRAEAHQGAPRGARLHLDVSDVKDRGYFDSVYVRTPGGALFEATVSKPKGLLIDEPFEKLGSSMQVPPVFAHRKDELIKYLESACTTETGGNGK